MIKPYVPNQLFIESSVRSEPLTRAVLKNLPGIEPQFFEGPIEEHFSKCSITDGKGTLVLARKMGRFLKSCPGSKDSLCCGYFILESSSNCNYECTYCILQTYLNQPPLIIYANLDDMFNELTSIFELNPKTQFRIGTGELSDSLSLDPITEFSKFIVPFFAKTKNACLELKTKSTQINNLKELNHQKRTIASWSLNTKKMAHLEELKTPSLEERINAARLCQEWGYLLSFHLEPLFYYPGWENDYEELVRMLFDAVDPQNIVWISLGGVRLPQGLKGFTEDRFPKSTYLYGELIPGTDGKLRYLKVLRLELYRKISSWIRKYGGIVPTYLCMESSDVWSKGLGQTFEDSDKADEYLSKKVFATQPPLDATPPQEKKTE